MTSKCFTWTFSPLPILHSYMFRQTSFSCCRRNPKYSQRTIFLYWYVQYVRLASLASSPSEELKTKTAAALKCTWCSSAFALRTEMLAYSITYAYSCAPFNNIPELHYRSALRNIRNAIGLLRLMNTLDIVDIVNYISQPLLYSVPKSFCVPVHLCRFRIQETHNNTCLFE